MGRTEERERKKNNLKNFISSSGHRTTCFGIFIDLALDKGMCEYPMQKMSVYFSTSDSCLSVYIS